MNKVDISFIIPAFNIDKYLSECVDSILNQTGIDCEIIIINDGSTDDTLIIAKEYETLYSCVKVIDKKNEGVSVARNIGINQAIGEYCCFVDGDDYFIMDCMKLLFSTCKSNNLDIIRGQYTIVDYESYGIYPNRILSNNHTMTGKEFLKKSMLYQCSEVVPWLGLFKKDFLIKNNILFPIGISYTEDQLFFLSTLLIPNCRIQDISCCYYAYRKRTNSSTDLKYSDKKINDILYVVSKEIDLIKKNKKCKKYIYKFSSTTFSQLIPFYHLAEKSQQKYIRKLVRDKNFNFSYSNSYSLKIWIKYKLLKNIPFVLNLTNRR